MGVSIWEGGKAQDLIDAITGLPNATQAAADAANTAATETARCNIAMSKSGNVITVTITDRNNQQTSYTVTDPSGDIAMLSEGNTHGAIVSGQYVYITGHGTLTDGLYQALTNIAANETLTTFNVAAITDGGLNDLRGEMTAGLDRKADKDGTYDTLTAGNAEQLVSTVGVEDSVPYNFRTAGGSANIGDREVDKLVGGTVAWNQLLNSDKCTTRTTFSNGVFRVNYTSHDSTSKYILSSTAIDSSHKILITYNPVQLVENKNVYLRWYDGSNYFGTYFGTEEKNIIVTGHSALILIQMEVSAKEYDQSFRLQYFDLTQMFGRTIADYIYSLETATGGAGVAWFRNLFPNPYYAYDAGSLQSVQAKSHIMTGFNQWDEQWENGQINADTGVKVAEATHFRSKNYIPVVPNTTYYIKGYSNNDPVVIWGYDVDKKPVKRIKYSGFNGTFTTSDDRIRYILFSTAAASSYTGGVCINLHWDGERDGEYEPYTEHAYPLDADLVLRGIPKLDSNNKLYYDGDEYANDGTVTRKYGIVDLGTLTWNSMGVTDKGFYTNEYAWIKNAYIICAKYSFCNGSDIYNGSAADKTIGITGTGTYNRIRIKDTQLGTDIQALISAVTGVYMVYELATPTTETADPYQNPQVVDDFGTEEYVDAGVTASTPTRDVAIPVGHNTFYQANLRAKVEMLADSPDGNGDYILRQSNGQNAYVPLTEVKELPDIPETDGTYSLKVTISSGTPTLAWVSE